MRLDIIPVHLHREDYRIQVADFGSRYYDADDWAIDRQSYLDLTRFFEPTIDLFAHFSNAKCKRFYSPPILPAWTPLPRIGITK